MKKILFTLLFMASVGVSAQKIIYDKTLDHYRCIATSRITARYFTDTVLWTFGIKGCFDTNTSNPDSAAYVLSLHLDAYSRVSFPKNATLLIKTFKDEVIELTSIESYQGPSRTINYYVSSENVGSVTVTTTPSNYTEFIISVDDIEKLKDGVKKVRVQTSTDIQEKEYRKDKCGEELYKSYELIKKQFTTTKSPDIHDNF